MKKTLLSLLIMAFIFLGIDNVNAAACYMCGTSNNATYTWADSNPNSNSCTITNKTEDNCSGSYDSNTSANTVSCGDTDDIPAALPVLTSNFISAIKILVPIILIIFGMLDFARATMAGDDKAISESRNKFIKRTIAAVIVFLVVVIVQLGFSVLGDNGSEATACIDCFVNGDC